ncbi:hypothetical protein GV64_02550 [Endozoicomonas elysicola]|uniref:Uncharacterized protein n=1 Tax=Endozoicomonas elysicola TaxID=305900 RepID=A0A081K6J3_9GAMM|nr:hypothetical protein GV64_02550 [Endozoicomonas elysicola]
MISYHFLPSGCRYTAVKHRWQIQPQDMNSIGVKMTSNPIEYGTIWDANVSMPDFESVVLHIRNRSKRYKLFN